MLARATIRRHADTMAETPDLADPQLLHQLLRMTVTTPAAGLAHGRFQVANRHMAPNGYLHAASVIALADSCCGMGCMASLPEGARGFTTIELKSNFLGTARPGDWVAAEARMVHGGRTTQVWDAEVRLEHGGKSIALFRCTQMLLYAKG
ncbi:MAG: thioesterase superfamily protein [Caulobacteraceae bacterium]|nr:thioesterase superfamily protein [Caulobacteraceae bacterium]